MAVLWPASLPQFALRQGYNEGFKSTVVRSATDSGITKRRQRFINGPQPLKVTIPLDDAQVATFKTFYEDDLGNGAARFDYPHPRLGTIVSVAFAKDLAPLIPEGATTYLLTMELNILP